MEFHTLQDFMTFTKGTTYIVAILSLGGFLAFWRFLIAREDDDD